jgi:RimJ/RimL family protein N-acetyltransferase
MNTKKTKKKSITSKGVSNELSNKLIIRPKKSVRNIINIHLSEIHRSDRPELINITSKSHIMKFIGTGKTWTLNDVDKYINYTIQDAKIPTSKRTWFSYAIRHNGKLIGVIEFKCISIYHVLPFNLRQKYKNDVALTIYINDTYQGKGIARISINQLKLKICKLKPKAQKLISLVKSTNLVMQQAMDKLGFTNMGLISSMTPALIVYTTNIKNKQT